VPRQGGVSFTTVLTAEQNLLQAQNSLASASANVPLGLTAVFRALGGGWQIRVNWNGLTMSVVRCGPEVAGPPSNRRV
jgi:hypothetical protein